MPRTLEIGTLAIGGLLALGIGYGAMTMLAGDDTPSNTLRVENTCHGFAFDCPSEWRPGLRQQSSVRESVGRDGELCYVNVLGGPVDTDAQGVPKDLRKRLAEIRVLELQGPLYADGIQFMRDFGNATLGGQDARRYSRHDKASVDMGVGTARAKEVHIRGRFTLRDFGIVAVTCVATAERWATRETRAAFDLVLDSFRFVQRP
jgi:hypothetical protein